MKPALFLLSTILSLGLNILIDRMGLNPRWKYLLWCVIAANELRGCFFAFQGLEYFF